MRIESTVLSIKTIGEMYGVDGDLLARQYKQHISGFEDWDLRNTAEEYVLFPENIGTHLSIDETCLSHDELYTIVTNKDGIAEKQDLIVGKYYYREISAPDKYIVDSKEKSFKLTDNGEIFEATVYNEAKTLPVTGGSLSLDMLIVLMVAGLSIVGFTTMKVIKAKKEQN